MICWKLVAIKLCVHALVNNIRTMIHASSAHLRNTLLYTAVCALQLQAEQVAHHVDGLAARKSQATRVHDYTASPSLATTVCTTPKKLKQSLSDYFYKLSLTLVLHCHNVLHGLLHCFGV